MLTKRDSYFFNVATVLAKTSEHKKAKMGAVIVSSGNILSMGVNSYKSHPLQKKYDAFRKHILTYHNMHAEISAISKVKDKRELVGSSIYITRVNKDVDVNSRQFNMSRPCISCMRALFDFGIKNIYYTSSNGFVYEKTENINS